VSQGDARVEQVRSVGAIVTTEASRQAETNLDRALVNLARIEPRRPPENRPYVATAKPANGTVPGQEYL
jgi:hypothetical protein